MRQKIVYGQTDMFAQGQPRYEIPSMVESLATAGTNGYNVISTFSGCGGSSLGLKMAGFAVPVAVEFVPAAAETYRANAPETNVLEANIRELSGQDLLSAAQVDEIDVFEGSPPCASFSVCGRREEHWGKEKAYSDTVERVDDLFDEYIRLVGEIKPKVFIAENVTGMGKGGAIPYLREVIQGLADKGYAVKVKTLDAQWLGVPQRRKRLIFIGTRNDLGLDPKSGFPRPRPYRYTLQDALDYVADQPVEPECWMDKYAVGDEWKKLQYGQKSSKYYNLYRGHPHEPCGTLTQTGGVTSAAAYAHPHECRKFSVAEAKAIQGFPPDFILTGNYKQQYERLGRAVPPLMYKAVGEAVRDNLLGRLG